MHKKRHNFTSRNVKVPFIGKFELRDDGERHEAQLHERVWVCAAQGVACRVKGRGLFAYFGGAQEAHKAAYRQLQLREDIFALGDDDAAPEARELPQRRRHGDVVHASACVVVCVVGDGGGDGAAHEAEAVEESDGAAPRAAVFFNDGHLRQFASRVGAGVSVYVGRRHADSFGDDLSGDDADDVYLHAGSVYFHAQFVCRRRACCIREARR